MTAQAERLHVAGAPTALPAENLHADLDVARARARAAMSDDLPVTPENIEAARAAAAAYWLAYQHAHARPALVEFAWAWGALAVIVAALILVAVAGGVGAALYLVGGGGLLSVMLYALRRMGGVGVD